MTPQPELERIADRVAHALLRSELAVFAGAGISMGGAARLPGWAEMIRALLGEISGPDPESREEFEYVTRKDHGFMDLLFNEVALQLMTEHIGLEPTAEALRLCLDSDRLNYSHHWMAWADSRWDASLLTTNFDEQIEKAGVPPQRVLKLHGTLASLSDARFTVNNVFSPLRRRLREETRRRTAGRSLLVLGYGGEDQFDVLPALFDGKRRPKEVFWLYRSQMKKAVERRFRGWPPGSATFFRGEIDPFLRMVYERVRGLRRDAESSALDEQVRRPPTPAPEQWLRPQLEEWGRRLREQRGEQARYVWARLLDQLRIYQVLVSNPTDDGSNADVRNFARQAYQRFFALPPASAFWRVEAEYQLAVIDRTMGAPRPEAFAAIDAFIDGELKSQSSRLSADSAASWRRLQGRVKHQYAVALQSLGLLERDMNRLRQAKDAITAAHAFRREHDDDEAAYSLFQRFIMAVHADRIMEGAFDEFAPPDWREGLAASLEETARRFQRAQQPADCGNSWHNAAFVHQTLADRLQRGNQRSRARIAYLRALNRYERGREIRDRLRDRRLIAQSDVRICECQLWLADLESLRERDRDASLESAKGRLDDVALRCEYIKILYQTMPQESFRWSDLERIDDQLKLLSLRCDRPAP